MDLYRKVRLACSEGMSQREVARQFGISRDRALLHKSIDDRSPPFPGHTCPAATVVGMPSAVKRLSTAARIWTSATWRSKSRDISRWPSCFTQFIFVSTLLRRWCPLQFRPSARPRCFDARRISLRARTPAVSGFQGRAFRRGGSEEVQQKVRGTFCPTNRRCSAGRDGIMAGARAIGVASGARTDGASAGNSAVTVAISSSAGIWASRSGSIGASPTLLDVTSTARISNVCPSIPRCILRRERAAPPVRANPRTRRFEPPCLRVCRAARFRGPTGATVIPHPSLSTLMPVLSAARQDIAQQCPRGDGQVQRALGAAVRDGDVQGLLATIEGSNKTVSDPRCFSASLAAALGPVARNGSLCGPVGGLVGRLRRFAHASPLLHWIHEVNPGASLYNNALLCTAAPSAARSFCVFVACAYSTEMVTGSFGALSSLAATRNPSDGADGSSAVTMPGRRAEPAGRARRLERPRSAPLQPVAAASGARGRL